MDTQVNYMPVSSNLNWDEYFMLQAMMASFKSKDPNTKVGCVFVDDNNHQLSMGYNGQIAGIDESFPCHECAKMMATVKIKEVVFLSDKYNGSVENLIAKRIFDMSQIKYRELKMRPNVVSDLASYFQSIL